ncbi:hypothetical protein HYPSUDRAFT_219858 [Hypholoma sublateritium FD-334 SS-4]|uniref:Uncharacterized protein n=1 Tax=Hypholoma sublateritium (strain FD-334 SS-4) TaxID=945553 RepID=A0A0D2KME7_HYPSF|nr:hypothetical protein HYPSUDRAFT_219858 [Hypholoma sublateritium FD-334 SS-4]
MFRDIEDEVIVLTLVEDSLPPLVTEGDVAFDMDVELVKDDQAMEEESDDSGDDFEASSDEEEYIRTPYATQQAGRAPGVAPLPAYGGVMRTYRTPPNKRGGPRASRRVRMCKRLHVPQARSARVLGAAACAPLRIRRLRAGRNADMRGMRRAAAQGRSAAYRAAANSQRAPIAIATHARAREPGGRALLTAQRSAAARRMRIPACAHAHACGRGPPWAYADTDATAIAYSARPQPRRAAPHPRREAIAIAIREPEPEARRRPCGQAGGRDPVRTAAAAWLSMGEAMRLAFAQGCARFRAMRSRVLCRSLRLSRASSGRRVASVPHTPAARTRARVPPHLASARPVHPTSIADPHARRPADDSDAAAWAWAVTRARFFASYAGATVWGRCHSDSRTHPLHTQTPPTAPAHGAAGGRVWWGYATTAAAVRAHWIRRSTSVLR